MPKFRITTKDPRGSARTLVNAPNEEAAAAEAQRALRDMTRDNLPDGEALRMEAKVEDLQGGPVYDASLDFSSRWPEQIRRSSRKTPKR